MENIRVNEKTGQQEYVIDFCGVQANLPILPLPSGVKICFFNLHGNVLLTEKCAELLTKKIGDCEVLITAESKGLQLTHCVARNMGMPFYAVARKSKKLYMQDGIDVPIASSITTGKEPRLYLSRHDVELIKGKKVCIVDDVVSTGASLAGLEALVEKAGGIVYKKAFVLAEGKAANRPDVIYLDKIPVCVAYDIDGDKTTDFPNTPKLNRAKPVFEYLDGWKCDIRGTKNYAELPENAKKYVEFVEKHIGRKITMISTGPNRNDFIIR